MPTTERLRTALAERYTIDRPIGAGGMATVYLARDLKHDREVAVKVLRADLSAVIGAERFLSEVRITAKLDHPHILTLIDSGAADGILYYVLPYVRGETLRAKLQREKQLGIDDALSITRQIAAALDYAHRQGVVHRDIKPENILFQEGEAVLADFGIALAVKEAGGNRLTETGLSLGTPQYMSPEQATGDRSLDARSDIYSLGAVLYEMLVGEPPVTGATAQAMIAKLLTERPTSIRVVRETVPIGVDSAVNKALAKVPADRFLTAGDFARALDAAVAAPVAVNGSRGWMKRSAIAGGVVAAALVAWFAVSKVGGNRSTGVTIGDRSQITFTGRVKEPALSADGKQIAYVVTTCQPSGCNYGIDLQDVGGTTTRRVFDGASALQGIEWSDDRRNLLFVASINQTFGSYIVSALGGEPRRVNPLGTTTFWANGDSLISLRSQHANPDFWLLVGGLDGAVHDSIRVAGPGESIGGVDAVPNSSWIVVRVQKKAQSVWLAIDRAGQVRDRLVTPPARNMSVTSDALWMEVPSGSFAQGRPIVRVGFDSKTGRFATHGDTVYRLGSPDDAYTTTNDGKTFLATEGITEFDAWSLDVHDLLRGAFGKEQLVLHSTSEPRVTISTDGKRLLIGRVGAASSTDRKWAVMSVADHRETPLTFGGRDVLAFWVDSVHIAFSDRTAAGSQLALVDARTGARSIPYEISDPTIGDFTALPSSGWAWIPTGRRTVSVGTATSPQRQFSMPPWFEEATGINASADGKRLVITGWKAPDLDSTGVTVMSLADGSTTQWATVFAESGWAVWLDDGSLLFGMLPTAETTALYRLRRPGQMELLGTIPRPIADLSFSRDLKRAAVVTRDYHGDAWLFRVKSDR